MEGSTPHCTFISLKKNIGGINPCEGVKIRLNSNIIRIDLCFSSLIFHFDLFLPIIRSGFDANHGSWLGILVEKSYPARLKINVNT